MLSQNIAPAIKEIVPAPWGQLIGLIFTGVGMLIAGVGTQQIVTHVVPKMKAFNPNHVPFTGIINHTPLQPPDTSTKVG